MRLPRAGGGDDLDQHTQLYIDVHIALECLHITYPEYIQKTTSDERLLYGLYLALKAEKDTHAMERSKAEAEMERLTQRTAEHGFR